MHHVVVLGFVAVLTACGPSAPDPFAVPWVRAPFTSETFIVRDPPLEAWMTGPPRLVKGEQYGAERDLVMSEIPEEIRERIGHAVTLWGEAGPAWQCAGVVGRLRAIVRMPPAERAPKVVAALAKITGQERAAYLWSQGHPALVAEVEAGGGCPDIWFVTALMRDMPRLAPAEGTVDASTRAAMRGHGLWEVQEEAYQATLKANALVPRDRWQGRPVPAHWDAPYGTYDGYRVTTWSDAGRPVLTTLRGGNNIACAVPRTWSLWSADLAQSFLWGISDWEPRAIIDLEGDGQWEVVFAEAARVYIARLDGDGSSIAGRLPDVGARVCDDDMLRPPPRK